MNDDGGPEAVLITGTVGAGKTTTAELLGARLTELEIPHAVVDVDWLSHAWPAPADDPFNESLAMENLAAVSQNLLRAGARRLVLAGVLETAEMRAHYEQALGIPLVVCRLGVGLERVRARLVRRHRPGAERDWHLRRSGELDGILRTAGVSDVVVEVEEHSPELVAELVLQMLRWA